MFIYKADFNLFRYSSIFLPYIPHAVYSQLELVMDFTYSIYYFIVFMYLSGREFLYICIGVYMNTHSKAVKCRKRDPIILLESIIIVIYANWLIVIYANWLIVIFANLKEIMYLCKKKVDYD